MTPKNHASGHEVRLCFWEDRNNTLCKSNYQICSTAIVSFSAAALTMDFQPIPLLIHVGAGAGGRTRVDPLGNLI